MRERKKKGEKEKKRQAPTQKKKGRREEKRGEERGRTRGARGALHFTSLLVGGWWLASGRRQVTVTVVEL